MEEYLTKIERDIMDVFTKRLILSDTVIAMYLNQLHKKLVEHYEQQTPKEKNYEDNNSNEHVDGKQSRTS